MKVFDVVPRQGQTNMQRQEESICIGIKTDFTRSAACVRLLGQLKRVINQISVTVYRYLFLPAKQVINTVTIDIKRRIAIHFNRVFDRYHLTYSTSHRKENMSFVHELLNTQLISYSLLLAIIGALPETY